MNKREVAEYLGVSDRAINRYTSKGKLHVSYRKRSKGSKEGVYDPAEVKKLKQQFETPVTPQPRVENDQPSKALARRDTDNALAGALIRIAESTIDPRGPTVPLRDALTLTLDDAVKLCPGLSKGFMLEAIKAGDLKAIKRRGWVVTRAALDAWVKKLWMK